MSLRGRLIAGLLVLAAAALVVLAAVTYAEQRSFLLTRVDQQAAAAEPAVSRLLDDRGATVPGAATAAPRGGGRHGPGGGGGPTPFDLTPGTFGQRRDASGKPLKPNVIISYGQTSLPAPKLPANVPVNKPITVASVGSGGVSYRVLAKPTGDQPGTTIVAVPLRDVEQTLHRLVLVEALVIGGVLLALAVLAWWLVRLGLRPLDRIAGTAAAIAAGDMSQRVSPATKRTEVGRLGLALNSMLAQIDRAFKEREASESRLRRFVADASHELRTPLASIRGYAELFRIGAARSPAETEKAMNRIEGESKRMGELVESLLVLARLDQAPEVSREPVDLVELASDAADDARAVAPDRRIELHSDGPAMVTADSSQLRQVITNLVRNAQVHTPPGTPIDLNVAVDDGLATLEVRDHGPGLPTDDSDALFERFWRADPGRARDTGGAGLGLSIVSAIVEAHGGSVSAANAVGGGALFTIHLPLSASAGQNGPGHIPESHD